jgi:predicted ester cyclase
MENQIKKLLLILPLALILCFLFGCQDKEAMAELEVMKAQAEDEEENKALVLQVYEEFDKKNFEILVELANPDMRIIGMGTFESKTIAEVKPILSMWYEAFPDYTSTIEEAIAKGDKVAVRLTFSGTHEGEFFGFPASGNKMKYGGIHMWEFKDGKLTGWWPQEDFLWLMQQLGMELKPKERK